jgi:hypothetical protein
MSIECSVGDIVTNTDPQRPLVSGSQWYDCAIVVQTKPLVLVSEEADMRWESTIQNREFSIIGKADEETIKHCMKRL